MKMCTESFMMPESEYETILEVIGKGNCEILPQWKEWEQLLEKHKMLCKINLIILSELKLPDDAIAKICEILHVEIQT